MQLDDAKVKVQLFQLRVRGKNKLADALLSPEVVSSANECITEAIICGRLQVDFAAESKQILLPLKFCTPQLPSSSVGVVADSRSPSPQPEDAVSEAARWRVDERCVIDVVITKSVQGATAPDKLVNWLAKTVLPGLLIRTVEQVVVLHFRIIVTVTPIGSHRAARVVCRIRQLEQVRMGSAC